jgi:hypothetical protein
MPHKILCNELQCNPLHSGGANQRGAGAVGADGTAGVAGWPVSGRFEEGGGLAAPAAGLSRFGRVLQIIPPSAVTTITAIISSIR